MMWLRQSTASQEILLGRFVDSANGNDEEIALTIAATDIKLWKEGATTLANKNSGGATHIANGLYYAVLDATDTATLGKLEVHVHVAGALSVKREFMVLLPDVYDALVLGGVYLPVDVAQVGGVAVTTSDGTATAGGANTITLATGVSFGTNVLRDRVITIISGTGAGQSEVIASNTNATPSVVTITRNWLTAPDATSTYVIEPSSVAASVAAEVSANVKKINDVTLLGDGTGTPFDVE